MAEEGITEKLLAVLTMARRMTLPALARRRVYCPGCRNTSWWQPLGDIAVTDGELLRILRELPECPACGRMMEILGVEVLIRAVRNEARIKILGSRETRAGDLDDPAQVRVELNPLESDTQEYGMLLPPPTTQFRAGLTLPGGGRCMRPERLLPCEI